MTDTLWMSLLAATGGLGLLGTIVSVGWAYLLRRPQTVGQMPRDLLILAAHQDDCVIMAGECAIEAAKKSGRVQVIYLTCGAPTLYEPRVAIRQAECEKAWALVGVPAERLSCLNLPQSNVEGPSLLTEAHLHGAAAAIVQAIRGLPHGAAMFMPAAGEKHCDHRSLRQVALEAHEQASRADVVVYEAAEYNALYDLFQMPGRGLLYVAGCYPGLGRLIRARPQWKRAGFAWGARPQQLAFDADRLEMKRKMLRQFKSEGAELLVQHFGYTDSFRPVDVREARRRGESLPGYVRIASRRVGLSTLVLLVSAWWVCLALAGLSVHLIARLSRGHAGLAAGIGAGVGALICAAYAIRSAAPERRLTGLICAAGFVIAGVVPSSAFTEW